VDLLFVELTKVILSIVMFIISIVKQMSQQMSTGKFFTTSSFISMQDRCGNTDRKSNQSGST